MSREADVFLRHLPEIYQTSGGDIQQLLTVFEAVLLNGDHLSSGDGSEKWLGLEQKIAAIPNLFDPKPGLISTDPFARTPQRFLPWLAEWVALSQLQLLSKEQSRFVIANIIPLYSSRGTKSYLSEILSLYFPGIRTIIHDQELPTMTVGKSKVGEDTRLGGDIPFYFYVKLQFSANEADFINLEQMKANVSSVIDLAKPAHTAYQMAFEFGVATETNDRSYEKNDYLP